MLCPACQSDSSRVADSRSTSEGVRRRRECSFCGERFSTIETVLRAVLKVVKKDGRSEEFQRGKLLAGLVKAAVKCNVSDSQLENIVDTIETHMQNSGIIEIKSSEIGELAIEELRNLDHIAYIRFASVYRSFVDVESLKSAIQALDDGSASGFEARTLQLAFPNEGTRNGMEQFDENRETVVSAL